MAEYIDYPIAEAVIDYILLPHLDNHIPMMYVIVVKESTIANKIAWARLSGLKITTIDICQNALKGISFDNRRSNSCTSIVTF